MDNPRDSNGEPIYVRDIVYYVQYFGKLPRPRAREGIVISIDQEGDYVSIKDSKSGEITETWPESCVVVCH